ncbi:hypothetical protein C8Q73DRAFT_781379 [Cubamyces lactineus]|nr:hypothetical protein C8Q73DRAFT_781379 [Cubamyces lactineus]
MLAKAPLQISIALENVSCFHSRPWPTAGGASSCQYYQALQHGLTVNIYSASHPAQAQLSACGLAQTLTADHSATLRGPTAILAPVSPLQGSDLIHETTVCSGALCIFYRTSISSDRLGRAQIPAKVSRKHINRISRWAFSEILPTSAHLCGQSLRSSRLARGDVMHWRTVPISSIWRAEPSRAASGVPGAPTVLAPAESATNARHFVHMPQCRRSPASPVAGGWCHGHSKAIFEDPPQSIPSSTFEIRSSVLEHQNVMTEATDRAPTIHRRTRITRQTSISARSYGASAHENLNKIRTRTSRRVGCCSLVATLGIVPGIYENRTHEPSRGSSSRSRSFYMY